MMKLQQLCDKATKRGTRACCHAPSCRDLIDGAKWRESLVQSYDVPGMVRDFECPYSIQWERGIKPGLLWRGGWVRTLRVLGWLRKPSMPAPGDAFAYVVRVATLGRVKPCATCKSRRKRWNTLGWKGCALALLKGGRDVSG